MSLNLCLVAASQYMLLFQLLRFNLVIYAYLNLLKAVHTGTLQLRNYKVQNNDLQLNRQYYYFEKVVVCCFFYQFLKLSLCMGQGPLMFNLYEYSRSSRLR